jgi:hypothetical protein
LIFRTVEILTWDGILPLFSAVMPTLAKAVFPNNHIVELLIVFILPMCVAIFRATNGIVQLRKYCGTTERIWRQVVLAFAIIVLLVFEIAAGAFAVVNDPPDGYWLFLIAAYVTYVALILLAFRRTGDAEQV